MSAPRCPDLGRRNPISRVSLYFLSWRYPPRFPDPLLVSSRFGLCVRQRDSVPESFTSSGLLPIQPKCHIDFHNIALVVCGPAARACAEIGPRMRFPRFSPRHNSHLCHRLGVIKPPRLTSPLHLDVPVMILAFVLPLSFQQMR